MDGKQHQIVNGIDFETVVWTDNEVMKPVDLSIYNIKIINLLISQCDLKTSKKFI